MIYGGSLFYGQIPATEKVIAASTTGGGGGGSVSCIPDPSYNSAPLFTDNMSCMPASPGMLCPPISDQAGCEAFTLILNVCPGGNAAVCNRCQDYDSDGVCNPDDNCRDTANADQLNNDGDPDGNACDCAPNDSAIHSQATEIAGDNVDQNCDTDELCYFDTDNDGYRTSSTFTSSDTDCNDSGE